MERVLYLCNGKNPKCKDKCKNSECTHTSDPNYAKNFTVEVNNYGDVTICEKTPGDNSGTFII